MHASVCQNGISAVTEACHKILELEKMNIPKYLVTMGSQCLRECRKLEGVYIPETVETIGSFALTDTLLTKATVPGTVKTIERYSFHACPELSKVVLENGVRSIDENAFSMCEKLEYVYIPVSVTSLEYAIFSNTGLNQINYGGTVAQWEKIKKHEKRGMP